MNNEMVKYEGQKARVWVFEDGDRAEWLKNQCDKLLNEPEPEPVVPPQPRVIKRGTAYTGLIKSTADLCYWANRVSFKHRCARCEVGITKKTKNENNGVCNRCHCLMQNTPTCSVCFKKIHDVGTFNSNTVMSRLLCLACHARCIGHEGANTHGHKEGGGIRGGMQENFWMENENDNVVKLYEDGGQY